MPYLDELVFVPATLGASHLLPTSEMGRSTRKTTSNKPLRKRAVSGRAPPAFEHVGYKLIAANTHQTRDRIVFYHGILSNHYLGEPFFGHHAFSVMTAELGVAGDLSPRARLINTHSFNCGEQFIMAMKAFTFEPDTGWPAEASDDEIETLVGADGLLHDTVLYKILRSTNPKEQKMLGRSLENFDEKRWAEISMAVVTAAIVARSAVSPELRQILLESGERQIFEASPRDKKWGAGRGWKTLVLELDTTIGENRLGKCYERARVLIREQEENDRRSAQAL
jgi:ribA/ribD-fused uncharacterized protein